MASAVRHDGMKRRAADMKKEGIYLRASRAFRDCQPDGGARDGMDQIDAFLQSLTLIKT
jgi:hypothetical protein